MLWAVWDASGLASSGRPPARLAAPEARRPTPTSTRCWRCSTRRPGSTPGCRRGRSRLFLDSLTGQEIAGDTLAERAQARRRRHDLDRAPGQGPGVGPGRRRRGPGGHLARPAAARLAARDGRAGRGRGPRADGVGPAGAAMRPRSRSARSCSTRSGGCSTSRSPGRGASLVVTAVGGEDSEERPSRFLAELAGDEIAIEEVAGIGRRWLSLPALTADLRRAAADRALPAPVRAGSGRAAGQARRSRGAGASPRQWYALTAVVRRRADQRRRGQGVALAGGQVRHLRVALADRVGGRRQPAVGRRSPRHRHPRGGCARRRGRRPGGHRRADRRDLAPARLRQRLVQRQAARERRARWWRGSSTGTGRTGAS